MGCALGWCSALCRERLGVGVFAAVLLAVSPAMGASENPVDIEVFTRPGCPHCAEAEHFLAALARERPELRIVRRDVVADRAALDRLRPLATTRGRTGLGVPTFVVGGELVVGFTGPDTTGREIRRLLGQAIPSDDEGVAVPLLGRYRAGLADSGKGVRQGPFLRSSDQHSARFLRSRVARRLLASADGAATR